MPNEVDMLCWDVLVGLTGQNRHFLSFSTVGPMLLPGLQGPDPGGKRFGHASANGRTLGFPASRAHPRNPLMVSGAPLQVANPGLLVCRGTPWDSELRYASTNRETQEGMLSTSGTQSHVPWELPCRGIYPQIWAFAAEKKERERLFAFALCHHKNVYGGIKAMSVCSFRDGGDKS